MIVAFWLGVLTSLWVATVVAVGYAIWRYVFQPWKALRADVVALNAKLDTHVKWTQETLTSRRMAAMTDEELASVERRLRRDSAARVARAEVVR